MIIGYSVIEHHDDGSTKVINKVTSDTMAALISGMGGTARGQYTYLNADECPVHGPWRAVPAGVSKTTQKPYPAFWACDQEQGEPRCTNKPSKDWVETHPADRKGNDASQVAPEPTTVPSQTDDFSELPF